MKKSTAHSQWSIVNYFLLSIVYCLLFTQCSTYKVEYAFPEDAKNMQGYDELMSHLDAGKSFIKLIAPAVMVFSQKAKKIFPIFRVFSWIITILIF